MTQSHQLEAKEVSFGYTDALILEELSLALQPGEILALVGPNGCGKTTLLKQLSGVLEPQRGHVWLDGQSLHTLKPRAVAQQLAALEQHIQVDFAFNVEQLVSMGRLPYLRRLQSPSLQDREIVQQAMARTGVTALSARSIDQLSSGERQRVWLAMALAQEPRILLLDEPTSHLDIKYQMEMLERLHQLSREGLSVAMSMHELHLAAQFADRVALIHKGKLHAIGPTEAVLNQENIQKVFQVDVEIIRDPRTDAFLGVLPRRNPPISTKDFGT